MRADNTAHLLAAARARADATRDQAVGALRRMIAAGDQITFESVARMAGVSRSWLYTQPDLRTTIAEHRGHQSPAAPSTPPRRRRATDASLLRRLEAAAQRIQRLENDNQNLRHALEEALGAQRAARVTNPRRDTPGIPSR